MLYILLSGQIQGGLCPRAIASPKRPYPSPPDVCFDVITVAGWAFNVTDSAVFSTPLTALKFLTISLTILMFFSACDCFLFSLARLMIFFSAPVLLSSHLKRIILKQKKYMTLYFRICDTFWRLEITGFSSTKSFQKVECWKMIMIFFWRKYFCEKKSGSRHDINSLVRKC